MMPQGILIESFLSFLGLGVQEPLASWGVLIEEGAANMESSPWMLIFPATFLAVTSSASTSSATACATRARSEGSVGVQRSFHRRCQAALVTRLRGRAGLA
jgi:hypothetical protein